MKQFLLFCLVVAGLVLLATPLLPLGLGLLWLGWWVYERSAIPDSDALVSVLMVVGGAGALATICQFIWQRITAQP